MLIIIGFIGENIKRKANILFFYFLTKKLHIFVAFGDYNFFTIGIALRTEMLREVTLPTQPRKDFKFA